MTTQFAFGKVIAAEVGIGALPQGKVTLGSLNPGKAGRAFSLGQDEATTQWMRLEKKRVTKAIPN